MPSPLFSQNSLFAAAPQTDGDDHEHSEAACPLCDQPIPHERLDEINARVRAREEELAKHTEQQVLRARNEGIAAAKTEADLKIKKLETEIAARESQALEKGRAAGAAAAGEKIAAAEQTAALAAQKHAAAEEKLKTIDAAHQAVLESRLLEQREALEKSKVDALNATKSEWHEEKLKLSERIESLQRSLDKKSAEELGDGAEIDLFEDLKAQFEDDKIERIKAGQPGADIRQTVIHNGKTCGTILYDSKNRDAWRNDYVTKLKNDQIADKAAHAILVTRKFPSGARYLHAMDGVLLVMPSRAVVLAGIVRDQLVRIHSLRLSGEERAKKTEQLYDLITSDRCLELFGRIETQAEALSDLQVAEKKAHDAMWKKQGQAIASIQKARADLIHEIDSIIGAG